MKIERYSTTGWRYYESVRGRNVYMVHKTTAARGRVTLACWTMPDIWAPVSKFRSHCMHHYKKGILRDRLHD